MSDHSKTKVVVLGGGYAGALAANHLHVRDDVEVTLVNPRSWFVERIRLHQLAAGTGSATVDFARVLNPAVHLVVDEATSIDASARSVSLASGTSVPYDYLIYAVGSTAPAPSVPGAAEFALRVAEYQYASSLRDRAAALDPAAPVCVVGGGLTGIEVASELAARHPVHLVGDELGASLGAGGRSSVLRQLRKLGVTVVEGAVVASVSASSVVLADGRSLPSALTVWTAGFGVPDLAARSGLTTDALGRLLTDETLTSVDDPRIVAAGDAAAPSDQPLRMSCQAALPLGAQAANTVLSRLAGESPAAVDLAFAAQCLSLGRSLATFQAVRRDDTPVRFHLGGRAAAWVKEFICKGTVRYIVKEGRKPGSYRWFKGGRKVRSSAGV